MELSTLIWIAVILTAALAMVFIPRYGLLAVFRSAKSARERERIEDALKHLLDQSWENHPASTSTLKSSLGLSDREVLQLVNRMVGQGLARAEGTDLFLTPEGERLAIQVTRAHRLLERYLADEARMPLEQIHEEAHHREHLLSIQQVDELEAALGHPAIDPHGDPIPDHSGKIKPSDAKPLTSLAAEVIGRIVHIEDEPAIAYAQIQAEGIHLGQTLRLVESAPDRLVVTDGSSEYRLAPIVAANVHFKPVERLVQRKGLLPLHRLAPRQKAEIVDLDQACQGFTRRRFLDLGLTPGTIIFPELPNPFGDPRAYRVRGTLIALRKDQADQIWVQPVVPNQPAEPNPQAQVN